MALTEDELRAAIKAMIDGLAKAEQPTPALTPRDEAMLAAIDATHAARKRHPIDWPEAK